MAQYVRRRNGVPLGHKHSLRNMLDRSLGASSLTGFWQHWNPIWSYGLGRFVQSPLQKFIPSWLALIFTFAVSGLLHDLAIMAARREIGLLVTPWFTIAGIAVVVSSHFEWHVEGLAWPLRAAINLAAILASLAIALRLTAHAGVGF